MSKIIPGPKGLPIVGDLRSFMNDVLDYTEQMRITYGDIVQYRLLNIHAIQLNNPAYVQEVLVGQADKFSKHELDKEILGPSMGKGLVINDGESHRYQRKLIQPAFHTKRIENYAEIMTSYTNDMLAQWDQQTTLDIHREMNQLTLRIVVKTLYDADVQTESQGIGAAVDVINHTGGNAFRRGFVLPMWLPVPEVRAIKGAVKTLDDLLLPIIEQRRQSQQDHGDLLSMLLMSTDEEGNGMSDRQLRDEVVTLFLAGHETTATALTWTWVLLSQNPEAEARLHHELDTILGGRTPTLADLKLMPYTEKVIKESMRLMPPVWSLNGRKALQDVTIDGYVIPKDSRIFILPYVIHRDPRYYDQPARFMPERWDNDFEKTLPRYAYMPFGGGVRVCIGNSFAMMEARLLLAAIAQRYRVQVSGDYEVEPAVTLHPRGAVNVRLDARAVQSDVVAAL